MYIRSVKESGMVTDELVVKERGIQAVKTASHMVRFYQHTEVTYHTHYIYSGISS